MLTRRLGIFWLDVRSLALFVFCFVVIRLVIIGLVIIRLGIISIATLSLVVLALDIFTCLWLRLWDRVKHGLIQLLLRQGPCRLQGCEAHDRNELALLRLAVENDVAHRRARALDNGLDVVGAAILWHIAHPNDRPGQPLGRHAVELLPFLRAIVRLLRRLLLLILPFSSCCVLILGSRLLRLGGLAARWRICRCGGLLRRHSSLPIAIARRSCSIDIGFGRRFFYILCICFVILLVLLVFLLVLLLTVGIFRRSVVTRSGTYITGSERLLKTSNQIGLQTIDGKVAGLELRFQLVHGPFLKRLVRGGHSR
mmetsp:Transcript_21522/g.64553  ORF Transcript_21522/g.64553 Transcript_21522/m.64553 type:complete len:311 (+) Transcript_21522:533-1465(+)